MTASAGTMIRKRRHHAANRLMPELSTSARSILAGVVSIVAEESVSFAGGWPAPTASSKASGVSKLDDSPGRSSGTSPLLGGRF